MRVLGRSCSAATVLVVHVPEMDPRSARRLVWPRHVERSLLADGLLFQVEYRAHRHVDPHEFAWAEAACEVAESLRVHGGGLLHEDPDVLSEELNRRMDHGTERPGRRWGDEPGRQVIVGA